MAVIGIGKGDPPATVEITYCCADPMAAQVTDKPSNRRYVMQEDRSISALAGTQPLDDRELSSLLCAFQKSALQSFVY